ncbi:MAG: hypothetical protein IPK82_34580 [Polyangiaceae bacterium]|nr:hypothetical protein [Polyangiaceae bacterium]
MKQNRSLNAVTFGTGASLVRYKPLGFAMAVIAAVVGLPSCDGGETGAGTAGSAGATTSSSSAGGSTNTGGTGGMGGSGGMTTSSTTTTTTTTTTTSSSTTTTTTTSSSTTTTTSGTGGGVPMGAKRVFVTSSVYTGNLMENGNGVDGLDGGDKLCQLAADAAGLGGQWTAWLSTTDVNAIDRIGDVGPWYRLDGVKVFNNKASIVTTGPAVPIDVDEQGGTPMVNTWTGTKDTGMKNLFRCNDWTNDAPINGYEGSVGITAGLNFWTEGPSNPCNLKNTLYCFEQ